MTIITETISNIWDNFAGRCVLLGLPFSWGVFALLSMAHGALVR